jgi:hypothetical protein
VFRIYFEESHLLSKKFWEEVIAYFPSIRYIRALFQKNKGCVEMKQRPIKMDNRTIYRTLSPKGTPFQTGIDG